MMTATAIEVQCPTTVYVVVAKDKHGFMRGFEKAVNGRFYMSYGEAVDALRAIVPSYTQSSYRVGEAVIGWWPETTNNRADWPDSNC